MTQLHPRTSLRPALLLAAGLALLGPAADAQAFRAEHMVLPGAGTGPVLVEGTATEFEVSALLTGLARIESDLQLGMLFAQEGLTRTEGSPFSRARAEVYPTIRDGLAKAGIADFEDRLSALEAGGDSATVTAAYTEAVTAIMSARSVLRPSARDMLLSIVDQTRTAAAEINPAGPTEVQSYQDAWAMLMVARTQIDLLTRGQDAAVVDAAKALGLAFDDIIIFMPDPGATGPVTFDPALLLQAISKMEALAGSV